MKITTINTIELSSVCNNKCQYCPAPEQHKYRKTGLMEWVVFERTIELVLNFAKAGTQLELNLFGVGEPTLHPDVVDMVRYARNKLPFRQILHLNTNGKLMTDSLAHDLKEAGISKIDITGHDAFDTAKTIRIFQKAKIPFTVSYDFALSPNNWAGQVDWFEPQYNAGECPWLSRGQIMVMSNGDLTTCCIDAFGKNIFGTVFDDLSKFDIKPSDLCFKCHHSTGNIILINNAQRRLIENG